MNLIQPCAATQNWPERARRARKDGMVKEQTSTLATRRRRDRLLLPYHYSLVSSRSLHSTLDDCLTLSSNAEPNFGSFRRTHTGPSEDGTQQVTHLSIKCSLGDIARATNLRVDDCAWAMREAGFLARSKRTSQAKSGARPDKKDGTDGAGDEMFFISKEMVEQIAKEWGVKRMMMEVEYVKV